METRVKSVVQAGSIRMLRTFKEAKRVRGVSDLHYSAHQSIRRAVGIWAVVILLSCSGRVSAQTTNATCESSDGTKWMFNDAGESPCLTWSKIQSLCLPQTSYINVPPLGDASFTYNPPSSRGTRCQCNSVSYSLMSACALCQWADTDIPSEEAWFSSCESYTKGLDFDQSVLGVPAFAYHDWSGETFNPDIAKTISAQPASTPHSTTLSRSFSPVSTTSASGSSASASSSAATATSSSSSSSSSSDSSDGEDADPAHANPGGTSKWGPIIGGIAGAVALLVLLLLLWRWYVIRRRRRHGFGSQANKKHKKRIPYPYPSFEGDTTRPGGPGGRSFLDMVTGSHSNSSLVERDRHHVNADGSSREMELKRRTAELMSDPSAFAEPRTAPPVPFGCGLVVGEGGEARADFTPVVAGKDKGKKKKGKGKHKEHEKKDVGGYKTTTQRLAGRPVSLTSTDIALATASKNRDHNAFVSPNPPSKAYLTPGKRSSSSYNADSIDFSSPSAEAPLLATRRLSALSGMTSGSESSMSAGGILSPQDFKGDENASRAKSGPKSESKDKNKIQGRLSAIPPAAARKYFSSRLSELQDTQNHNDQQTPSMDFSVAPATATPGAAYTHTRHDKDRDSGNTLPSLYEPQTGAMTYRASANTMFSADMSDYDAHYPGTQTLYGRITGAGAGEGRNSFGGDEYGTGPGRTEVIGAALGSGKKGRESLWDRPWDGGDSEYDISPKTKR